MAVTRMREQVSCFYYAYVHLPSFELLGKILAQGQFHGRIINKTDVLYLPRAVVFNDNEPNDTSLFRVLITLPCNNLKDSGEIGGPSG